ncbi:uncharacterized protein BBOV_IV005420 [Babesia bovis T2Bo]|uniref:Inhibitor of growth protein N-terminal histone-binding domain-containing protein n=1 Tax=Babesia bovis TaxID=5865 RepID=A7AQT4_BABBO|nr:uncharacterized protein BBOV_IV005420 [Babesia bovis T2Bo]EDO06903.1 hypothetical protein BBOV_IV005420 [Babesia bovis T2Bo]|eukprot:XP_001610471.1 hypothetical protein [Babesia bovis T2Bo]
MDASDDITDELLTLPGFIRRNLLLMRELDVKFISLLESAKSRENEVLSTFTDTPSEAASTAETKVESSPSPLRRQGSDGDKSAAGTSKSRAKGKQSTESKSKAANSESKRQCRGSSASSNATSATDSSPPAAPPSCIDPATQKEIDAIQSLRMDAMHLMYEKLAINDQVTSMLKGEYENLKNVFDNMYREMENAGQMTEKLRASFTVAKSKSPKNMDALISSTEKDILGTVEGSTISASNDPETSTPSKALINGVTNSALALKDDGVESCDSTII